MFKKAILPIFAPLAILVFTSFASADMIGLGQTSQLVVVEASMTVTPPVSEEPDAPLNFDQATSSMTPFPTPRDGGPQFDMQSLTHELFGHPTSCRLSLDRPLLDNAEPFDGILKIPIASKAQISVF